MDCCGPSKPKETDKDTKQDQVQTGTDKNPAENEQKHSGGCCGGGMKDMLLHIALMIAVVLILSYFTRG